MDDMNAFERQVANEVVGSVRPPTSVDAMAIAGKAASQSPRWRLQSMFSATKFVFAGAIVALLGGFLLAGLLATQPSEESMPAVGASASATTAELPVGEFTSVESLAGAPIGTSTLLQDGRVLLVGDTRAAVWDPATESLDPAGEMETPRPRHGATLLPDGRVLVVGGDHEVYTAEAWDPATGSFSPAGSFSEWHSGWYPSTTVLSDGRVLVMGGGDHHSDATQVVEVWDPETATFLVAGEMSESRAEQTATLLRDGRVLVVGGELLGGGTDVREAGLSPLATAEVWDPETESFGPAGTLGEGRAVHTATLLQDGRVLMIGGGDSYDYHAPLAEVWDPVTESFTPAGSLTEARSRHTATLLPDGRVLVIGGWNGDEVSAAEVWDPVTLTFSPAGSLLTPRNWHSATLLPDGRVLVVDGLDGSASAEIWSP